MGYVSNRAFDQQVHLAAIQAGLAELSRLQQAVWAVASASPKLAEAAWRLDREAAACMGVDGTKDVARLREALASFTELAKRGS